MRKNFLTIFIVSLLVLVLVGGVLAQEKNTKSHTFQVSLTLSRF